MKLLYAIQGTGNGHLGRAMEIAPFLVDMAEVDFLISGTSRELDFPYPFQYKYHGLSFYFGSRGGVDYLKSFGNLKLFRLWEDIKTCPVEQYDCIVNDFEPVSAWAAQRKKVPVVAVSHQASFFSDKVPLPKRRNKFFEYGMKNWVAPADGYVGLHYKAYDDHVLPPIIRQELVGGTITNLGHITVYLPSFADDTLIKYFNQVPNSSWQVFSKKTDKNYSEGNVLVHRIDKAEYSKSLLSCQGLLTGGGFQATSEALYLGKKLMAIPMFDQYEQKCNAAALKELGVKIISGIDRNFNVHAIEWLTTEAPTSARYYEPSTKDVAHKIVEIATELIKK